MEFANPVKLLGRILLLVYGFSGGSNESLPPAESKQQIADGRAARLERLLQAREVAARQAEDVLRDIEDMLQEIQRFQKPLGRALHVAEESLEA